MPDFLHLLMATDAHEHRRRHRPHQHDQHHHDRPCCGIVVVIAIGVVVAVHIRMIIMSSLFAPSTSIVMVCARIISDTVGITIVSTIVVDVFLVIVGFVVVVIVSSYHGGSGWPPQDPPKPQPASVWPTVIFNLLRMATGEVKEGPPVRRFPPSGGGRAGGRQVL